jgi:hypothetical protein
MRRVTHCVRTLLYGSIPSSKNSNELIPYHFDIEELEKNREIRIADMAERKQKAILEKKEKLLAEEREYIKGLKEKISSINKACIISMKDNYIKTGELSVKKYIRSGTHDVPKITLLESAKKELSSIKFIEWEYKQWNKSAVGEKAIGYFNITIVTPFVDIKN